MNSEFDLGKLLPKDLKELLSTMGEKTPIPKEPQNLVSPDKLWNIESLGQSDQAGFLRKVICRQGLARVDFNVFKSQSLLRWDSNIPDNLTPNLTAENYIEDFEKFLFYRLPKAMKIREELMFSMLSKYKEASTFILKQNNEQIYYTIGNPKDYLKFVLDFCRPLPERSPSQLFIRAVYGTVNRTNPDFDLTIDYPSRLGIGGMRLLLPRRTTHQNSWNPDVLKWVLESHCNSYQVEDIENSAIGLSNIVTRTNNIDL